MRICRRIAFILSFAITLAILLATVGYDGFVAQASYSGKNAAKYAIKYALNYNTKDYDKYPKGDCTNFTSQCLVAGGFPMIILPMSEAEKCFDKLFPDKTYHSYAYFSHVRYNNGHYNRYVSTTPWSLAGAEKSGDNCFGFYDYIKHYGFLPISFVFSTNVEAKKQQLFSYASVGDIIQIRHSGSVSTADHTYIVTGKEYGRTCDPYPGKQYLLVCAHTGDRCNSDILSLIDDSVILSSDTVYLWRITAFNMNTLSKIKPVK